jgi:RNA polymerase sigma factor (sigma-70 family)
MALERLIMARRHHVVRSRRAVGREISLPDQSSVMLGRQLLAPNKSPSQQLHDEELAQLVQRALDSLSAGDREILLMRSYEALSYEEIACVLDIEPAAARKRNGRALVRLHKLLTDRGLSESKI